MMPIIFHLPLVPRWSGAVLGGQQRHLSIAQRWYITRKIEAAAKAADA
jgi:hypothetical protein